MGERGGRADLSVRCPILPNWMVRILFIAMAADTGVSPHPVEKVKRGGR
jgi:hypothetical protein